MNHLEKFAGNNHISIGKMSMRYMMANQPEKALDWLEKGYELRDNGMPTITSGTIYEPLYDEPRFIAICKKMNLPLPKSD